MYASHIGAIRVREFHSRGITRGVRFSRRTAEHDQGQGDSEGGGKGLRIVVTLHRRYLLDGGRWSLAQIDGPSAAPMIGGSTLAINVASL